MTENNDLKKNKEALCLKMATLLPLLRNTLHLSQTRLGEYVGVSRQTISAIERGEYQMSWNQFASFYLVFGGNKESHAVLADNDFDIQDIAPAIVVARQAPYQGQDQEDYIG